MQVSDNAQPGRAMKMAHIYLQDAPAPNETKLHILDKELWLSLKMQIAGASFMSAKMGILNNIELYISPEGQGCTVLDSNRIVCIRSLFSLQTQVDGSFFLISPLFQKFLRGWKKWSEIERIAPGFFFFFF